MKIEKLIIDREICRAIGTTDLSANDIAQMYSTTPKRVSRIKKLLLRKSFGWLEVEKLSHQKLQSVLYPKRKNRYVRRDPNWHRVFELMKNKHQTLVQLWEEYRLENPTDAYSYTQFTVKYNEFVSTVDVTMRQIHRPGEKVFVDFAGLTIPYIENGVKKKAHIFVAVSGASNYTFAVACRDQSSESWINAHNLMFRYFGGVHQILVPDNLKAAVISAGSTPVLNRVYLEMAKHYGIVIAPARVRKPQDKSKAELGVLFVSRWITAPLRRREFFSLEEINEAIREMLPALNERKFKRISGSRHLRFLEVDKPALKTLPNNAFEFKKWLPVRKVPADYHVVVEEHAYSVPYKYVGKPVEICFSHSMIQIFYDNKRIASHKRSYEKDGRTLDKSHFTKAHQHQLERELTDYVRWAKSIGPYSELAVEAQFEGKQPFSPDAALCCDKLKRLSFLHGEDRFEAACKRASYLRSFSYKTINSILARRVESLDLPENLSDFSMPLHANIRGSGYYQPTGGQL